MAKSSQGGDQLVREARIALPILGLLFLAFILAGYRRFSGWGDPPPASVPAGPTNSAPPDIDSFGGQATPTAPSDTLRSPSESVPTLPGAEIRRPPNLDRLTQPPRDRAPSQDIPSQGYPNPNHFRRLPNEPHSPARGEEARPAANPFPPEKQSRQSGNPERQDSGELTGQFGIREFERNRQASLDRHMPPGTVSESQPPRGIEPPRTLPETRNNQPLSSPGFATPIQSSLDGEATNAPIRRTGLTTPNSQNAAAAERIRRDLGVEDSQTDSSYPLPAAEPVEIRIRLGEKDSYWTIAEQAYGSGQYFRAVHAYLQDQGMTGHLRPGFDLILPSLDKLARGYADLLPHAAGQPPHGQLTNPSSRSIIATGNSSLFEIAAEQLGQAARFDELLSLNRGRLPNGMGANDLVPAGTVIDLPPR